MGEAPDDLAEFDQMASHRRSASRAVLKSFEQIEDQLARAFRVIPQLMAVDARRWFARDHADFMERWGVLDNAADWTKIVKLRNELVHDYPLKADVQFARLLQAVGHLPLMLEIHRRLALFVRDELPGHIL